MIKVKLFSRRLDAGRAAAGVGAKTIRTAIETKGRATVVVATGASQFEMQENLVQLDGIDWSKVTAFHLDEYIGISDNHPASFRRHLRERFTSKLPTLGAFQFINGEVALLDDELAHLNRTLDAHTINVTFAGIGENGHAAFNDPPADFEVAEAYKIVNLDEHCRRQQIGEGWFSSYEAVPERAISMTAKRILSSGNPRLSKKPWKDRLPISARHRSFNSIRIAIFSSIFTRPKDSRRRAPYAHNQHRLMLALKPQSGELT